MYLTFYHQKQGLTFVSITPRIEAGTQLSIKKYLLKELTQIDELFLLLLAHHLTSFLPLLPIIVLNIQSTRQLTAAIPQIYARKKNDSICQRRDQIPSQRQHSSSQQIGLELPTLGEHPMQYQLQLHSHCRYGSLGHQSLPIRKRVK